MLKLIYQIAFQADTKWYLEKYEHLSDRLLSTFKSLCFGGDVWSNDFDIVAANTYYGGN